MPAEPVTVTLTYKQTSLTIRQSGVRGTDTVFYSITGINGTNFSMTVAISGEASVNIVGIPLGNYRIAEISDNWTWIYGGVAAQDIEVSGAQTDVAFTHGYTLPVWRFAEAHN